MSVLPTYRLRALWLLCLWLGFVSAQHVYGQQEEYYYIPEGIMRQQDDVIVLEFQDRSLQYDSQTGAWLETSNTLASNLAPLSRVDDYLYSSYDTLRSLGIFLPRLRRVRTSDNGVNSRIVLEMESSAGLQPFRTEGDLDLDTPIRINLPALFLPAQLHQELISSIAAQVGTITIESDVRQMVLEIDPKLENRLHYTIFSLQNPMRLVVDLEHRGDLPLAATISRNTITPMPLGSVASTNTSHTTTPSTHSSSTHTANPSPTPALPATNRVPPPPPAPLAVTSNPNTPSNSSNVAPAGLRRNPLERIASAVSKPAATTTIVEFSRRLRPGITHRRFSFPTSRGTSGVHVVSIEPGYGHFRVVGTSGIPRSISELANGAFAAINASYFNTQSFVTIGLLKVDDALSSLPSRGRAAIAFSGRDRPFIGRIQQDIAFTYKGQRIKVESYNRSSPLFIYDYAGQAVGASYQGVIIVENGQVSQHALGPVTIPVNAFAIVYAPAMRDVSLYRTLSRVKVGEAIRLDVRYSPDTFQNFRYGVEAGPLLVKNGRPAFQPELEAFARNQRILDGRTQQAAIGMKADGTILLVTADAMIAEELVPLFIELGATEAMRLDSGSSASLFVNGSVVNRSGERDIVSAIAFLPY